MANKISYCPCCGEEFEDELIEMVMCPDCDKESVPGSRPKDFSHVCDCDRVFPQNPLP